MRHIRKGDDVVVVAGRDVGRRGKVLLVNPKKGWAKVERVNLIKRHVRPSHKHPQGGIIEKEGPINLSNIQLWDAKVGARCRVGIRQLDDGKKVRHSRKSGEVLE